MTVGGRGGKWGGWGGLVFLVVGVGMMGVRILEEERMLGEELGEVWERHVVGRWHLVPFVW